jgi:ABC-type transport system involved in Fe-S cluster assembly fused permease/ATPase subunit
VGALVAVTVTVSATRGIVWHGTEVNSVDADEAGTHDQLITAGGLYAGLYSLQAAAYGS